MSITRQFRDENAFQAILLKHRGLKIKHSSADLPNLSRKKKNLRKQETQQNLIQISAYFSDVSLNYYIEYHTDFQDRELKSEK